MSAAAVDKAYAEVQRVTRERAKNFAYGIMVLPAEKRRAIAAVYAFAREVDDVADGDLPLAEKRSRLEALRASLDDVAPASAMAVALTDARARFDIPKQALAGPHGSLGTVARAATRGDEELEHWAFEHAPILRTITVVRQ